MMREAELHEWMPEDYFREASVMEIFPERAHEPMEVDLGCGDGTFILDLAEEFPKRNFLAIERLLGRVRKVSRRAEERGLTNVKVLRLESKYAVEWLLPKGSFQRVHLLCPDPWPKAKHHKRRLFQKDFLQAVHKILIPSGEFLFKTDHEEYFQWAEEVMEEVVEEVVEGGRFFQRKDWNEEDFFYPKTDFQRLWESQGKRLKKMRLEAS